MSDTLHEQLVVALLGRRDEPTDAVEEYCRYLREVLLPHALHMELVRVPWNEHGWSAAFRKLRENALDWRGRWVFVQYTALAWSSRGFPRKLIRVLSVLRKAGARIGVVYHDAEPYYGQRLIDKVRRIVQLRTMLFALKHAELAVFTVSLNKIHWLRAIPSNAAFIPVGANFVVPACQTEKSADEARRPTLRVAVFGITGGQSGRWECERILEAVRFAAPQTGRLELFAFGRGAADFEQVLRDGLLGAPVDLRVEGLLPANQVAKELCSSDVMLFVRGAISSRRSSAISGIACGLPVIGYRGQDTAPPVTEAGVVLVSRDHPAELGMALLQVLTNHTYRLQLSEASRLAQEKYFSWPAIATRYKQELLARSNRKRA